MGDSDDATRPKKGTSDIIDDYFETTYKNQKSRYTSEKYRTYDGEHDESY